MNARVQPPKGELTLKGILESINNPEISATRPTLDLVISTAGLKADMWKTFPDPKAASEASDWNFVSAKVGARGVQKVARESKQTPGWFMVGPSNESLGALVDPSETVGATANSVSLFLNAPRSTTFARYLAGSVTPTVDRGQGSLFSYGRIRRRRDTPGSSRVVRIYTPLKDKPTSRVGQLHQPERVLKAEVARLIGKLRDDEVVSVTATYTQSDIEVRVSKSNKTKGGRAVFPGSALFVPFSPVSDLMVDVLQRSYFGSQSERLRPVKMLLYNDRSDQDLPAPGFEVKNGTMRIEIKRGVRSPDNRIPE